MSISSDTSRKKSIRIIRLYDTQGTIYEACVGARLDSLLEVDYRYSVLNAKPSPQDNKDTRVIQSLSYYNPIGSSGIRLSLPASHFHVKVDNPPHIRYETPRLDPPAIPDHEGNNVPSWVPPQWVMSKSGNPFRPDHVERIQGISNLVSQNLLKVLMRISAPC